MPNNINTQTPWQPSGWTPTRTFSWAPQPSNSGLPPVNQPGPGVPGVPGVPGNPGGPGAPPIGIGGSPIDPGMGYVRPHSGPDLGSTNVTMPGMFSPTGVGMPDLLPKSPRAILWDKLYGTMGY